MSEFWPQAEARDMELAATTRPVGQVVKTAASHAANMGSTPVRVTSSEIPPTVPFPPGGENCTTGEISSLSTHKRCAGL